MDDPRRRGVFVEKSELMEGSIVWKGKDPAALIGRADQATNDHVRTFFRSMADPDTGGGSEIARGFAAVRSSLDDLKDLGVDDQELADYIAGNSPGSYVNYDFTDADGNAHRERLRREVFDAVFGESRSAYRSVIALYADLEREREITPQDKPTTKIEASQPEPEVDFDQFAERLMKGMGDANERAAAKAIDRAFGRI